MGRVLRSISYSLLFLTTTSFSSIFLFLTSYLPFLSIFNVVTHCTNGHHLYYSRPLHHHLYSIATTRRRLFTLSTTASTPLPTPHPLIRNPNFPHCQEGTQHSISPLQNDNHDLVIYRGYNFLHDQVQVDYVPVKHVQVLFTYFICTPHLFHLHRSHNLFALGNVKSCTLYKS